MGWPTARPINWPLLLPGIRVEFHVAGLGHALPGVHLLDPGAQVVPDLVKSDLLQPMGVLGPAGRHLAHTPLDASSPSKKKEGKTPEDHLFLLLWASRFPPSPQLLSPGRESFSPCAETGAAACRAYYATSRLVRWLQFHSVHLGGAVCHT